MGKLLMFSLSSIVTWVAIYRDKLNRSLCISAATLLEIYFSQNITAITTVINIIITEIHDWSCMQKWNESGFRPPLCKYSLTWARRTFWGWWDKWDDTVLQTQDSKFEPWRPEAENATSRSRRPPTILSFTRGWGRNIFVSCKPPRPGTEPRTLAWKAAVLTTTLGPPPISAATLLEIYFLQNITANTTVINIIIEIHYLLCILRTYI